MPNIKLLNDTLALINLFPERHEQGEWRCNTGQCFAGWAALANGAKWVHEDDLWDPYVKDDTHEREHVAEYAQEVLNLTDDESDLLFAGGNTVKDLTKMVANLTNGVDIANGTKYDDPDEV